MLFPCHGRPQPKFATQLLRFGLFQDRPGLAAFGGFHFLSRSWRAGFRSGEPISCSIGLNQFWLSAARADAQSPSLSLLSCA